MSLAATIRYLYLAHLSKPKADRAVYRSFRGRSVVRILEIGVGSLERSVRLVGLAQAREGQAVCYSAIDGFEMRPEGLERLPMKAAYQQLRAGGAKVRLIPGDLESALAHKSHELLGVDLLLISAPHVFGSLDRAWFYVPRLLAPGAVVLVDWGTAGKQAGLKRLTPFEVEKLATPRITRLAA
ncbi:MAG: hypothetical protein HYS13_11420 [Planctomycetia bacterium]|nr:hypothetical protein [Planctomycetia bacterium]